MADLPASPRATDIPSPAAPRRPPPSRLTRALDELRLGATAVLVAAVLQLLVARLLHIPFSVYEWEWRDPALLWKTPWGYAMLFAPLAALLAVTSASLSRGLPLRASLTVWGTLILWAIALYFPQVHGWASLLLSAAIALQLAAPLARRESGTRHALRLAGPAALLLVGLSRPAYEWYDARRERTAVAALPAAAPDAPNVLLLVWDTVRAASLSLHGATAPTSPRLDQFAATGVTFDDAYSTAPWTLPSHASMFTGLYASASQTDFAAALPDAAPTLAEILRDAGYATAGFTANLMATRAESGLARGFDRYEDFTSSAWEIIHSTTLTQADVHVVLLNNLVTRRWWRIWGELRKGNFENNFTVASHDVKRAPDIARDFLAWQGALPAGRPFFAFLNFFDAHDPYQPPAKHLAEVSGPKPGSIDQYHGGIRFIDEEVGAMLEELRRRGVLDNTIVVVTSDHGEQFGEHGLNLHGNSLYRQVLHVPFVLVYPPRVPAAVRVRAPVTMRDLPATLLDLAGVAPGPRGMPGTSLTALWRDSTARGSDVVSEVARHYRKGARNRNRNGPMQSVVAESLHVIRDGDDRIEAYDIVRDGREERDLAAADSSGAPSGAPTGTSAADSLVGSLAGHLERAVQRHQLLGTAGYTRGTPRRR
jgi:arylsulfatase A-like enzyme